MGCISCGSQTPGQHQNGCRNESGVMPSNMSEQDKRWEEQRWRERENSAAFLGVPGELEKDQVDHPPHYKAGNMEAIDVIEALGHGHGFCVGNAIKYLWRAGKKQPDALQDLKKAQWYVTRAIKALKQGGK